jgi:hypothetical protein
LEPLRRFWTSNNLSDEDKFLRDYITEHRWREADTGIPTYDEVSGVEKRRGHPLSIYFPWSFSHWLTRASSLWLL